MKPENRGDRNHENLRRILTLIDIMAPMRYGERAGELHNLLKQRLGMPVSRIAVYRDLWLLESMGLAEQSACPNIKGDRDKGVMWKLDLTRTQAVQAAAMRLTG